MPYIVQYAPLPCFAADQADRPLNVLERLRWAHPWARRAGVGTWAVPNSGLPAIAAVVLNSWPTGWFGGSAISQKPRVRLPVRVFLKDKLNWVRFLLAQCFVDQFHYCVFVAGIPLPLAHAVTRDDH
jgi:hypothetical protein